MTKTQGPSQKDLEKVLDNAPVPSSIAGGMSKVIEDGIVLQEKRYVNYPTETLWLTFIS